LSDIAETGITRSQLDWMRRSTVVLACASNIASVACLAYQELKPLSASKLIESARGLYEDIFLYPLANSALWFQIVVNYGIWLAPTIAVLLLRKHLTAAVCYAVFLLPILLGRIYYTLPRSLTGVEWVSPKGDWSSFAQTFVGAASFVVIAIWVAVATVWAIAQVISLANGRGIRRSD
jgi:hypothetical protein